MAATLSRPGHLQTRPRHDRPPPHHRARLAQDPGHALADPAVLDAAGEEDRHLGRGCSVGLLVLEQRAGRRVGGSTVLAGEVES